MSLMFSEHTVKAFMFNLYDVTLVGIGVEKIAKKCHDYYCKMI